VGGHILSFFDKAITRKSCIKSPAKETVRIWHHFYFGNYFVNPWLGFFNLELMLYLDSNSPMWLYIRPNFKPIILHHNHSYHNSKTWPDSKSIVSLYIRWRGAYSERVPTAHAGKGWTGKVLHTFVQNRISKPAYFAI